MYRSSVAPPPRKGVILLVVLALLTLFTIVGISFVLYADAEATRSRVGKDANAEFRPDMDPQESLSLFLDQLLFDVRDDESGVYSSLRGHSLSRNMYGFNYNWADFSLGNAALTPDLIIQDGNDIPFSGVGRLHYQGPAALIDPTTGKAVDDWKLVNYTFFQADGFLRDPERYGIRLDPNTGKAAGLRQPGKADNRGPYLASANVPYTYPDLNNYYLGAIDSNGNLLTPSFHREWLFGRLDQANNPNWTNAVGKYLTARPRPQENPNFPLPGDRWGDVKNLIGFPGGNDSIWMDIGAPVLTTPDGRKYKMLVAPLIIELDGRLNVNVHGNIMGDGLNLASPHFSNFGLGPWEVNLGINTNAQQIGIAAGDGVLTALDGNNQPEWIKLFKGMNASPRIIGRYGPNGVPLEAIRTSPPTNLANPSPLLTLPHTFAQVDASGRSRSQIAMPGAALVNGQLPSFPTYPTDYHNGDATDLQNHAVLYNPFTPFPAQLDATGAPSQDYNRRFRMSNLERFYRWGNGGATAAQTGITSGDTGIEALTSELELLLPNNFNGNPGFNSFRKRNLVTLVSGDRHQPGIAPYLYNLTAPDAYTAANSAGPSRWATLPAFPNPANATASGEFNASWRSVLTASNGKALPRLDLNNPFPARTTGAGSHLTPYPSATATARFDTDANAAQFIQAQTDRQALAREIYNRLVAVTGLPPVVNLLAPTDAELHPRRWLAQLAVNIVDYIDEDDISTPFNFYNGTADPITATPATGFDVSATVTMPGPNLPPTNTATPPTTPKYWVFGTELPRVVINEVLVEYKPALPIAPATTVVKGATHDNKVWVELYNPLPNTAAANRNPNVSTTDFAAVQLGMPAPASGQKQTGNTPKNPNGYAAYQILVGDQIMLPTSLPTPAITDNVNVLGFPLNIRGFSTDSDFGAGNVYTIANWFASGAPVNANPATISPQTYLLLAPPGVKDDHGTITPNNNKTTYPNGLVPAATHVVVSPGLLYQSTYQTATTFTPDDTNDAAGTKLGVTVLLQRLANPHIPYNPNVLWTNPTTSVVEPNPWYNPYVTIDYMDRNPVHPTTGAAYNSHGKTQPYAAYTHTTGNANTTLNATSPVKNQIRTGAVHHTFGLVNNPLPAAPVHNDWLTHLDRQLISPIELLHVSQFQPHQLTQQFMRADHPITVATGFQHAPTSTWYDQTTRLYRLFEFLQTDYVQYHAADRFRSTGKINLNAIWDFETFLALCDPQPGNDFTAQDVLNVWTGLLQLRSPNLDPTGVFHVPGPTDVLPAQAGNKTIDRPFMGGAPGARPASAVLYAQNPQAIGINDTIFRTTATATTTPTVARLFDFTPSSGTDNPYVKSQILQKIFNNTTTRSNVFAVWITVGFFEVKDVDPNTGQPLRPVQLGAEMGAAEGRAIRHRMFAIIDRSVLPRNPNPNPAGTTAPIARTRFRPNTDATGVVPYWTIID